uniref:Protein kinase domain-containing protein n=2 Tax=Triticum TaxID=4564 RepID=A0A8R7PMV4_TRIUA
MDVAAGLHYVHHEHEHMVLHRDIKASNIMLDSSFRGRLGDFGLARIITCLNKNSYTDIGVAGTWGFIAPEYSMSRKATRKTDIYALGVLILEVVTGKRALNGYHESFQLLTDWVWTAHREGRLLEAVDDEVVGEFDDDDASRLLLLGLACTNPNPSDRPSMAEVVQIIAKSTSLPDVPLEKPTFVWPPEGGWIPLEFDEPTMITSTQWEDGSSVSSGDAL